MPTNLELASLEAFDDLLAHAGKSLAVGGEAVQGLVQFIEPENAVYSLEKGEGQDAKVKVIKIISIDFFIFYFLLICN